MGTDKLWEALEGSLSLIAEKGLKPKRRGGFLFQITLNTEERRQSIHPDYKRFSGILQEASHGGAVPLIFNIIITGSHSKTTEK